VLEAEYRGAATQILDCLLSRDETASCSDQIVFGDLGIARDLPAYKTTPIEFTPEKTGEFTFTCGMQIMCGKLIVESE